jgi:hypothetical protein
MTTTVKDYFEMKEKECENLFAEGILTRDTDKIYKAQIMRDQILSELAEMELAEIEDYKPEEDISTYETCNY